MIKQDKPVVMETVEKPKTISWMDELVGVVKTHAINGKEAE
jgi:hypothetical protein